MYQIDFTTPIHIHFIGIGGISMSGLAEILLEEGFTITGSDSKESPLTRRLEEKGRQSLLRPESIQHWIRARHPGSSLHSSHSSGQSGIQSSQRKESSDAHQSWTFRRTDAQLQRIRAVSGTHWKNHNDFHDHRHPSGSWHKTQTISVGGILKDIGGNIRVGGPDLFVTEACEYTNSFLSFYPTIEVILNIEEDHLDFLQRYQRYPPFLPLIYRKTSKRRPVSH